MRRSWLAVTVLVIAACGSTGGRGGSGGTASAAEHARAACSSAHTAGSAWQRLYDATRQDNPLGQALGYAQRDPAVRDAINTAEADLKAANGGMTAEAAQAAAADPRWDTLNRAMVKMADQSDGGGSVDADVTSTVTAECNKANAS